MFYMKQMERRWEDELPYLEATRAFYDTHFSLHCWLTILCCVALMCLFLIGHLILELYHVFNSQLAFFDLLDTILRL